MTMDAVGRHAEQAGFARIPADIVLDVDRCQPALVDALEPLCPDVRQILTGLRQTPPVAPDAAEGIQGQFYRLPHHYRSVCCALPELDTPARLWEGDVVTFKGTEPLMPDFDDCLRWMMTARIRAMPVPVESIPDNRWLRLGALASVNTFSHTVSDFSMSVGPEPTRQPESDEPDVFPVATSRTDRGRDAARRRTGPTDPVLFQAGPVRGAGRHRLQQRRSHGRSLPDRRIGAATVERGCEPDAIPDHHNGRRCQTPVSTSVANRCRSVHMALRPDSHPDYGLSAGGLSPPVDI